MSDKLGPVYFRHGEEHPFLGRELAEPKDFSEHTSQIIDDEIRRIIMEMQKKATDLLQKNRDKLDALAHALLEHETLENEDVDRLLSEKIQVGGAEKRKRERRKEMSEVS